MRRRLIDDSKLKELLRQGMTLKEMAKVLNVSHVAVHKRIKKIGLMELPESVKTLTDKERNFCLAVVSGQSRTSAVMQTYDVSSRESAKALQNSLMKNPEIKVAIDDLMELKGIGREYRIERLAEHMRSPDPVISLKSLDMGFKLSGDELEAKRDTTLQKHGITEIDPVDFKFRYVNDTNIYIKKEGKCTICEKESTDNICPPCRAKYPDIADKLTRYWAGDECVICKDDRRCFEYCKACKEKKGSLNHV